MDTNTVTVVEETSNAIALSANGNGKYKSVKANNFFVDIVGKGLEARELIAIGKEHKYYPSQSIKMALREFTDMKPKEIRYAVSSAIDSYREEASIKQALILRTLAEKKSVFAGATTSANGLIDTIKFETLQPAKSRESAAEKELRNLKAAIQADKKIVFDKLIEAGVASEIALSASGYEMPAMNCESKSVNA